MSITEASGSAELPLATGKFTKPYEECDMEFIKFLEGLLSRQHVSPGQMAMRLGISRATIHRWLQGKSTPSMRSCRVLATYSGTPLREILTIAGHLEGVEAEEMEIWPMFRDYILKKYNSDVDEDWIMIIEELIEHRKEISSIGTRATLN